MKLFQRFALVFAFAVTLSVLSGVIFPALHHSRDVSKLSEKLDKLSSSVEDLRSLVSKAMCSAVLASGSSLCRARTPSKLKSGCCNPKIVNLTAVSHSISREDKNWFHHARSIRGRLMGFWINAHDHKNEDTFVSSAIHNDLLWEPEIVDLFARTLLDVPPRQLVVDVGKAGILLLQYHTLVSS